MLEYCLLIQDQPVAEKKGNELATISVYLNTPIAAILLGVGFIASSVLFAGVLLIAR